MAESRLRLLDTVVLSPSTGPHEPTLIMQGGRMLRIRATSSAVASTLTKLRHGVEEGAVLSPAAGKDVRDLVAVLDKLGWLAADTAADHGGETWDRQLGWWGTVTRDGTAAQQRLAAASVAVLGVGGVGTIVARHLATGGVRELWLLDHDSVATHNLNRQYLFQRDDVGTPKAEAAAAALARITDRVRLRPVRAEVTGAADLDVLPDRVGLLVVAADRPANLMDLVWQWAKDRGVPVLGAGVGLETGYWGPLLDPSLGHCWPCFERSRLDRLSAEERRLERHGEPTPYSFGPTNAIISDYVARDAMLFLGTGRAASLGRRHVVNLLGLSRTDTEPEPVNHCGCERSAA